MSPTSGPNPGPTDDGLLAATAAIVVHHKSYPEIIGTVEALIAQGLDPDQVLVVDNSESRELGEKLRAELPGGVALELVPNNGYAAAINHAMDSLTRDGRRPDYLLVSTHETRPGPGALLAMLQALAQDERLGVVGPVLTNATLSATQVWSTGGRITSFARRAVHARGLEPATGGRGPLPTVVARDWLDGSFCLYRSRALGARRMSEDYFLYFEEVDFHLGLKADGWTVGCVTAARVAQSSNGMPPYYHGRNLRLFQHRHGSPVSRVAALPLGAAQMGRAVLARRRPARDLVMFLRGWFSWRQGSSPRTPQGR